MTDIDQAPPARPDGEYAIVEVLGHRTIIGRVSEVERFGAKLMSIEAVYGDRLLEPVLIGGGSIYQFTPCSAETAFARQPQPVAAARLAASRAAPGHATEPRRRGRSG